MKRQGKPQCRAIARRKQQAIAAEIIKADQRMPKTFQHLCQ